VITVSIKTSSLTNYRILRRIDTVNVNILTVTGKKKVFGRTLGKRKNYKKAYVTLKEGQDIDLGGAS